MLTLPSLVQKSIKMKLCAENRHFCLESVVGEVSITNERPLQYRVGSTERLKLLLELEHLKHQPEQIPVVIGGKTIWDDRPGLAQVIPHMHSCKIADYKYADEKLIEEAIVEATNTQLKWDLSSLEDRISVLQQAAELISTYYRQHIIAATMLGQGKTLMQAELDMCKLIDTLRFNAFFLSELTKNHPMSDTKCRIQFRGLEGFVAAVTPFNSTSGAASMVFEPVIMGNSVLWRPDDSALASNWRIFNILRDVGLPDGTANFVPCEGRTFAKVVTGSPYLAGISYAGSKKMSNWYYEKICGNIEKYKNYPRIIGECNANSYHLVHNSADIFTAVACTIRSAFEYSGQKATSCKRLYVSRSLKDTLITLLVEEIENLKVGKVDDLQAFHGPVVDEFIFENAVKYIEDAKHNKENEILCGGNYCNSMGYFITPTVILTRDPEDKLLHDSVLGPILTIYVYKDTTQLFTVLKSHKYALSGSVFALDRQFLSLALKELRNTTGTFYINDKSTGSIVGQQPFGLCHISDTNDKAVAPDFITRWTSPQTVTEN